MVLGGLLQDKYSGNQDKVPGLGDVPLFGNLFKSETRTRKKTNLMVFLRPVVVRDGQAVDALSMDRYELMRRAATLRSRCRASWCRSTSRRYCPRCRVPAGRPAGHQVAWSDARR